MVIAVPPVVSVVLMLLTKLDFSVALIGIFVPLQAVVTGAFGFSKGRRRGLGDALLVFFTVFFSALVLVLLLSVLGSVIFEGSKALSPTFIYENNRYVGTTTSLEYGGVGHAIVGTLLIVLLTTIVAVPMGIAMAVFLTQSQSKIRGLVRTVTQSLAGLPSVVSGLFVLAVMGFTHLERSGLTGAMALFPLMLPTVARVAEESLRLVPADLRMAALALGAPNYKAFFQVILPAAKSGIVTALLLGLARVVGETAPLILTININNTTNWNPFSGAIAALPTYVYSFLTSGYSNSQARAWGGALVLLIVVGILFGTARVVSRKKSLKTKQKKAKNS
jgi:phosphate transport system permease protein